MTNFKQVIEGLTLIERHRKDAQLRVIEGEIVVTFPGQRLHPRVRDALRRRGWIDALLWSDGNTSVEWRWRASVERTKI